MFLPTPPASQAEGNKKDSKDLMLFSISLETM